MATSKEYTTVHGETITVTTEADGFPTVENMVMARMMSVATTQRFGDAWKNDADDLHENMGCKIVQIGDMVFTFSPK